jgi:hypothetical protein
MAFTKTLTKNAIAGFALLGALTGAGIALAATSSADANGYCVSSAKGCAAAGAAGAQNGTGAASGAFGAFGPGNNFAGGANGTLTGISNSSVAGDSSGPGTQPTPRLH